MGKGFRDDDDIPRFRRNVNDTFGDLGGDLLVHVKHVGWALERRFV